MLIGRVWKWPDPFGPIGSVLLAFFSFGLVASAIHILADLLELEADRHDDSKRLRPFAAGNLSAMSGVGVILGLGVASTLLAILAPLVVTGFHAPPASPYRMLWWLVLYALGTIAYSIVLQRIPVVNGFVLGMLYVVPLVAGAGMIGITTWKLLPGI